MPHRAELGTPITHRPTPMTRPKPTLRANWTKKSAQSTRTVVQGGCRLLQIMRTSQPYEAIAQVLTLQENEDYEYRHNTGRGQRPQQGRNKRRDGFECRRGRLTHLDGDRFDLLPRRRGLAQRWRGLLRPVELFAEVLQNVGRTLKRAARRSRSTQSFDLFSHCKLVTRQIAGELRYLRGYNSAHRKNGEKR